MNASRILEIMLSPSGPFAPRGSRSLLRVNAAVVIAVLACVCSAGSSSAECIDYGDYLHWVGGVVPPSLVDDVAVSGSYAYISDLSFNFRVVDITNPASPQVVGSVGTAGQRMDIAVLGNYAYVAAVNFNVGGFRGLQVV